MTLWIFLVIKIYIPYLYFTYYISICIICSIFFLLQETLNNVRCLCLLGMLELIGGVNPVQFKWFEYEMNTLSRKFA